MIVLDEELQGLGLEAALGAWYSGPVILIKALRPNTVIKDEAIPMLLRQARQPTFVTINHRDFWLQAAAEPAFCMACMKLTSDQVVDELPQLLRRLLRLPDFKIKRTRMGKVALISHRSVQYYETTNDLIHLVHWPANER